MKITSSILMDFITDFKLETSEVGACFDAIINFNLPVQQFNLQSEVHMDSVLSNGIDTIYFLNPAINKYKLPAFFNDVNHKFLYLQHKGLVISGEMPVFGAYSISILPKSHTCLQKTYNELRAKKLN